VTDITSIASTLAKSMRMLASDKDGDVVAAAHAMIRVLKSIGADIHDVADRIEHSGNGALNEKEMQEIYDAGIKAGIRQQQHNAFIDDSPQFPSARDMALYCYQHIDELKREWEREFVTNMASWTRLRPLSVKQQAHLEKIYIKLGGRIE
jgi:hypothetical protein